MSDQDKNMEPQESNQSVNQDMGAPVGLTRREMLREGSRKAVGGAAAAFLGLAMSDRSTKQAQGYCCCANCWLNCADCLSGCSGCSLDCKNDCSSTCSGCSDRCTSPCTAVNMNLVEGGSTKGKGQCECPSGMPVRTARIETYTV